MEEEVEALGMEELESGEGVEFCSLSSSSGAGSSEETGESVSSEKEFSSSNRSETEYSEPLWWATLLFLPQAKAVMLVSVQSSAHSQVIFLFIFFIFTSFFIKFCRKYCQNFRKDSIKGGSEQVNSGKMVEKGNRGRIGFVGCDFSFVKRRKGLSCKNFL
jgi:hypothetical protein